MTHRIKKRLPTTRRKLNRRILEKRKRHDGCSGKKRFDDLELAQASAGRLVIKHDVPAAYVYLCAHGVHYHVSKQYGVEVVCVVEPDRQRDGAVIVRDCIVPARA